MKPYGVLVGKFNLRSAEVSSFHNNTANNWATKTHTYTQVRFNLHRPIRVLAVRCWVTIQTCLALLSKYYRTSRSDLSF